MLLIQTDCLRWVLMVHACNPNYLEGFDGKNHGSMPAWTKTLVRLHLNRKIWAWWQALMIPKTIGSIKWEDHNPGQPGQKVRPCLQNNQTKQGWRRGSRGRVPV
jgi:hypothetical protein